MALLDLIRQAVKDDRVEVSTHAYRQIIDRNMGFETIIQGIERGILLEDYSLSRGQARILVQQRDSNGAMVHVVWDAPDEASPNVVLVTAFYPDR